MKRLWYWPCNHYCRTFKIKQNRKDRTDWHSYHRYSQDVWLVVLVVWFSIIRELKNPSYCSSVQSVMTSAKDVRFYLAFCLSVSMLTTAGKNHWLDLHANFTTDVSVDKEELINIFLSHMPLDLGIFWRILQHCEIGHRSIIWLISLISGKNDQNFHENFITDVSVDKEVPIKFWKSGSGDWSRLCTWTGFTLAQVHALRMLLLATKWSEFFRQTSTHYNTVKQKISVILRLRGPPRPKLATPTVGRELWMQQ